MILQVFLVVCERTYLIHRKGDRNRNSHAHGTVKYLFGRTLYRVYIQRNRLIRVRVRVRVRVNVNVRGLGLGLGEMQNEVVYTRIFKREEEREREREREGERESVVE